MAREITPAQIKAVTRYEAEHYDKILLRLSRGDGTRDIIKRAAQSAGQSINEYILEAVKRRMEQLPAVGAPATAPAAALDAEPGGISPETIRAAEQAAKEAGETVDAYIARAVTQQAQRDAIARRLAGQYQEARQRQQARDERDNKE